MIEERIQYKIGNQTKEFSLTIPIQEDKKSKQGI